jgi:hypothetical protein
VHIVFRVPNQVRLYSRFKFMGRVKLVGSLTLSTGRLMVQLGFKPVIPLIIILAQLYGSNRRT